MSVQLSAKEAATAVHLSKAAILRAIHEGRLSATKDLAGQWCVDPVELYRVYPAPSTVNSEVSDGIQPVNSPSIAGLQVEIKLLRELLAAREDEIAFLRNQLELEQKRNMAALPGPTKSFWGRLFGSAA